MEQKIIKIGDSLGVIIPKKMLKSLGWNVGNLVDLSFNDKARTIIIRKQ